MVVTTTPFGDHNGDDTRFGLREGTMFGGSFLGEGPGRHLTFTLPSINGIFSVVSNKECGINVGNGRSSKWRVKL